MTDRKAIGLGLVAAGFWYLFLRGASALKLGLKSLRLSGISLESATLEVTLFVRNPLLATVFVREIAGTISVMGVPVGVIDTVINKRIFARSTSYIPVQVQISYAAMGAAAWQNIMSGNVQTLTVEFDGKIKAGERFSVPIPVKKLWTYRDIIEKEAQ